MPAHTSAPAASYTGALISSGVMFGICNLAWRLGSGSTLAIVLERSVLGALLVSPALWFGWRSGNLRALLRDPWAIAAVLTAGATLISAAFLFRWLPGPQSALVLAVTPAVLLLPSRLLTRRALGRALPFVLLSVLAAMTAAVSGGVGAVTATNVVVAGISLTTSVMSSLTMEHARARHSSWLLVACSMVVGAVGMAIAMAVQRPELPWSLPDLWVAAVIALLGTGGRVLMTFSLPHVGSVVTATSGQVGAAITAAGGVLFFSDVISGAGLVLALVAAGASVCATLVAPRTPHPRPPEPAPPARRAAAPPSPGGPAAGAG